MNGVSSLGGVFKVFEVFGFQTYSIESKLNQKSGIRRSIWSKLHLTFVWAINALLLLVLPLKQLNDYLDSEKHHTPQFFVDFLGYTSTFVLVCVNLVMSLMRKRCFIKFFKNADEISRLCCNEFGYLINYKKLKRFLMFINALFILQLMAFLGFLISSEKSLIEKFFDFLRLITFELVILTFVQLIFFVQIIHFNLEHFKRLIKRTLNVAFVDPPRKYRVHRIMPRHANTKKIRAITKIFCLIKEMTDQINKAMRFVVLIGLMLVVLSSIRNGHMLFMLIRGFGNETIAGKFLLC